MANVERIGRPRVGSEKRGASPLLSTRVDPATWQAFTKMVQTSGQRPSQLLREAIDLLLAEHSTSGASSDSSASTRNLPDHLSDLLGPDSGTVTPPASIARLARSVYNLDNRFDRAALYQLVITEGSSTDVLRTLNRDLLVTLWSALVLRPAIRTAWQLRFPELAS